MASRPTSSPPNEGAEVWVLGKYANAINENCGVVVFPSGSDAVIRFSNMRAHEPLQPVQGSPVAAQAPTTVMLTAATGEDAPDFLRRVARYHGELGGGPMQDALNDLADQLEPQTVPAQAPADDARRTPPTDAGRASMTAAERDARNLERAYGAGAPAVPSADDSGLEEDVGKRSAAAFASGHNDHNYPIFCDGWRAGIAAMRAFHANEAADAGPLADCPICGGTGSDERRAYDAVRGRDGEPEPRGPEQCICAAPKAVILAALSRVEDALDAQGQAVVSR